MDMTKLASAEVIAQDRIRLALNFDAPRMQAEVQDLFVYANNHYAGHGPATAADLRALGVRRVEELVGADPEVLFERLHDLQGGTDR